MKVSGGQIVETKKCTKCGKEKSLNEFNKNRSNKDCLNNKCRLCVNIYRKSPVRKEVIKKKQLEYKNSKKDTKKCSKCGKEKTLKYFSRCLQDTTGFASNCKSCVKNYRQSEQCKTITKKRQLLYQNLKQEKSSKICAACGQEKDISNFHKDVTRKGGLISWCKLCKSIKAKQYHEINKQKFIYKETQLEYSKNNTVRLCTKCCIEKCLDDFVKDLNTKTGLSSQCRKCIKLYKVSSKGKATATKSSHKRRTNEKNTENTLTTQEWLDILEEQDNTCNMCQVKFSDEIKPTCDHIYPVSLGGGLTRENVQALCRSCNCSKGAKVLEGIKIPNYP